MVALLISTLCLAFAAPSKAPKFWDWAKTPVMGWNSYDAFGDTVTESEVIENSEFMKAHLARFGWRYVVIDFRWYDPEPIGNDVQLTAQRTGAKLPADGYGRLLPAVNRFPSAANGRGFKALADRLHALGLKFGLHTMRGIPRNSAYASAPIEGSAFHASDAADQGDICGWCPDMFGAKANPAGQAWYDSLYRLFADWGLDFVKVDDLSSPYHKNEIEMIRTAIDRCGRKIIFSTSAGPTDLGEATHISMHANQWRISGDFWDDWKKLNCQFDLFHGWSESRAGGPGHVPDGDMIPLGRVAIRSAMGGKDHQSRFSTDERRTMLGLWALESSPLILGGNLPDYDGVTLKDLQNPFVISIDQDALGLPAKRVYVRSGVEAWTKRLSGGRWAVGLFNRTDEPSAGVVNWSDLVPETPKMIEEVWTSQHSEPATSGLAFSLPPHGSALYIVVF